MSDAALYHVIRWSVKLSDSHQTEPVPARQTPTDPDTADWTLSPPQETAVDLLASGKIVTETAQALEVTRQTVSGWLHHHPGFQAALYSRRQEL